LCLSSSIIIVQVTAAGSDPSSNIVSSLDSAQYVPSLVSGNFTRIEGVGLLPRMEYHTLASSQDFHASQVAGLGTVDAIVKPRADIKMFLQRKSLQVNAFEQPAPIPAIARSRVFHNVFVDTGLVTAGWLEPGYYNADLSRVKAAFTKDLVAEIALAERRAVSPTTWTPKAAELFQQTLNKAQGIAAELVSYMRSLKTKANQRQDALSPDTSSDSPALATSRRSVSVTRHDSFSPSDEMAAFTENTSSSIRSQTSDVQTDNRNSVKGLSPIESPSAYVLGPNPIGYLLSPKYLISGAASASQHQPTLYTLPNPKESSELPSDTSNEHMDEACHLHAIHVGGYDASASYEFDRPAEIKAEPIEGFPDELVASLLTPVDEVNPLGIIGASQAFGTMLPFEQIPPSCLYRRDEADDHIGGPCAADSSKKQAAAVGIWDQMDRGDTVSTLRLQADMNIGKEAGAALSIIGNVALNSTAKGEPAISECSDDRTCCPIQAVQTSVPSGSKEQTYRMDDSQKATDSSGSPARRMRQVSKAEAIAAVDKLYLRLGKQATSRMSLREIFGHVLQATGPQNQFRGCDDLQRATKKDIQERVLLLLEQDEVIISSDADDTQAEVVTDDNTDGSQSLPSAPPRRDLAHTDVGNSRPSMAMASPKSVQGQMGLHGIHPARKVKIANDDVFDDELSQPLFPGKNSAAAERSSEANPATTGRAISGTHAFALIHNSSGCLTSPEDHKPRRLRRFKANTAAVIDQQGRDPKEPVRERKRRSRRESFDEGKKASIRRFLEDEAEESDRQNSDASVDSDGQLHAERLAPKRVIETGGADSSGSDEDHYESSFINDSAVIHHSSFEAEREAMGSQAPTDGEDGNEPQSYHFRSIMDSQPGPMSLGRLGRKVGQRNGILQTVISHLDAGYDVDLDDSEVGSSDDDRNEEESDRLTQTSEVADSADDSQTEGMSMSMLMQFRRLHKKDSRRLMRRAKAQSGPVHFGFVCGGCGMNPIEGDRYYCSGCRDEYSLCADCQPQHGILHQPEDDRRHIFLIAKVKPSHQSLKQDRYHNERASHKPSVTPQSSTQQTSRPQAAFVPIDSAAARCAIATHASGSTAKLAPNVPAGIPTASIKNATPHTAAFNLDSVSLKNVQSNGQWIQAAAVRTTAPLGPHPYLNGVPQPSIQPKQRLGPADKPISGNKRQRSDKYPSVVNNPEKRAREFCPVDALSTDIQISSFLPEASSAPAVHRAGQGQSDYGGFSAPTPSGARIQPPRTFGPAEGVSAHTPGMPNPTVNSGISMPASVQENIVRQKAQMATRLFDKIDLTPGLIETMTRWTGTRPLKVLRDLSVDAFADMARGHGLTTGAAEILQAVKAKLENPR
jgi:hypothetical protein